VSQLDIRADRYPPYCWANANFAWNSLSAKKPWNESAPVDYHLTSKANLAVDLGMGSALSQPHFENLGAHDSYAHQIEIRHAENIDASCTERNESAFTREFDQAISLIDESQLAWLKEWIEIIHAVGQALNGVQKALDAGIALSDAFSRDSHFARSFESALKCAWNDQREILNSITDELCVRSQYDHHTLLHHELNLGIADVLGRFVTFHRSLNESFDIESLTTKSGQLTHAESWTTLEQYRRHANGVVSDLLVAACSLSEEEFAKVLNAGQPPGYTPFRDFMPGDYSYRRALFRTILETSSADRAYIEALRVTVDVPDMLDRGTAHVTDPKAGAAVSFTRTFNVPPEVTLTHKGGTQVAIARLTGTVTTKGFVAVLEDLGGKLITGSFTWVAQGY